MFYTIFFLTVLGSDFVGDLLGALSSVGFLAATGALVTGALPPALKK
jgi:hypothetical protein